MAELLTPTTGALPRQEIEMMTNWIPAAFPPPPTELMGAPWKILVTMEGETTGAWVDFAKVEATEDDDGNVTGVRFLNDDRDDVTHLVTAWALVPEPFKAA